ncbi:hypothetical protein [Kushneria phosphatilytica]|uniref:Uncharacterized protein n=1 Tax=Kushneria phosphatilytica TaxID=657387 RepID=A0A1S1NXA2_9GAMM|nr:hypothetical protein [Kushneria phosphatilytica]OHV12190.1 hypothetical protein BH688_05945 [Kushneria phosphatilytica]QEL11383.1 hypothetical protein FY550_09685 [Kushneria phosphatilytica]
MSLSPIVASIREDGLIELCCTQCEPVRSERYFDWYHFFGFAVARLRDDGYYVCCRRCGAGNAVHARTPMVTAAMLAPIRDAVGHSDRML